jgi:hypothetical protein
MNCRTLEQRTIEALEQLGVQAKVDKVLDLDSITSYGVMRTPGLVIDEKLVWQGGVPTVERIKELITAESKVS